MKVLLRSVLAGFLFFGGTALGQSGDCKPFDFEVAPSFRIGQNTVAYTTGDFNSDGKMDVAAANIELRTLSVISGDGVGGFGPPQSYPTIIDPRGGIASGHINNDGHLDLISASFNEKKIAILLNDGSGGFQSPIIYVAPAPGFGEFYELQIADFNLDGNNDIVAVQNQSNKQLSFFLGDGTGNLTQSSIIPIPGNEATIAVGNLNGDAIPDVVVSGGSPRTVYFVFGLPTGNFSLTYGFPVQDRPSGFSIADINNDTFMDLIIPLQDTTTPSTPSVRTWLGNGTGAFVADQQIELPLSPFGVTVADHNSDGHPDLAISLDGLLIITLKGTGNGTFVNAEYWMSQDGSRFVATADVDLDNRPDIVTGQLMGFGNSSVSVMVNDEGSGFKAIRPVLYGGTDIAAADMNNDSLLDMVTVTDTDFSGSSEVVIALNSAAGGLSADRNFGTPRGLRSFAAGDINNDGKQDIITTHAGNDAKLAAYLGDGLGGLGPPIGFSWVQGIENLLTGDFNGDGVLDVFIVDGAARGHTLLGAGDGHFVRLVDFVIDGIDPFRAPLLGEFNDDGHPDLITFSGSSMMTRLGTGDGRFALQNTASILSHDSSAAGDFNGDGNLDVIILSSSITSTISAYFGDGGGAFPNTHVQTVSGQGIGMIAGDFNTDGISDAAYISSSNLGNLIILPFTKEMPTAAVPIYFSIAGLGIPSGGFSSAITAGDYNSDGKVDIGFTARYISRGIIYNSSGQDPCISINDVQITEGDSNSVASFTVTLSEASTQPVSVNYSLIAGTATLGSDVLPVTGRLEIAAGQSSTTINVPIIGDLLDEFDETFTIVLASPSNASLLRSSGLGTIVDDDPEPTLTITDVIITEGFQAQAVFTAGLSAPSGKMISFRASTADGTATGDVDYFISNRIWNVPIGQSSLNFSYGIAGDFTHELDEDFFVNLSEPTNVTLTSTRGKVTILNDDPIPTVSIGGSTVIEGDTGITNGSISFNLTNPTYLPVIVNVITSDGTAIGGLDYVSSDSPIVIPAEQQSFSANLGIIGDAADERSETFFVNIYNVTNAMVGSAQSQMLIIDDDPTSFDFDRDGRTDISVFRPSDASWYIRRSQLGLMALQFGLSEDKIVPADFDGDQRTDIAVFRPSTGTWYIRKSLTGTLTYHVFGIAEDIPAPADYDGDGKADISVFRPSTGTWYRMNSSDGSFAAVQFGTNGDQPTIGDFDGDGKADVAVFRPSNGGWYQLNSSDGSFFAEQFGVAVDKIVPADYDGDGKTDIAIYRPAEGLWYVKNSATSTYTPYIFGLAEDIPTPGDYDGDGKADIAVFRPSNGYWYISNSSDGTFTIFPWGQNGDLPTPSAFGN